MGLTIALVSLRDLERLDLLERFSTIVVGSVPVGSIPADAAANLRRWTSDGGTLIGSATADLDDLFGVRHQQNWAQPAGPFSIAATFELVAHPLTTDARSRLPVRQALLALSPIRGVLSNLATALARLFAFDGTATAQAAITDRRGGQGHAVYFAFDLAQTIWALHKGKPIERDIDGDGYYRTCDLIAIGSHSPDVQYADELLWLVQNVLARTGQPLIHQLPPHHGQIPDLLCYWGGDDEAATNGLQRAASDFLRSRGLPYHINAMAVDGRFGLSPSDAAAIQANGHELSLHYNFHDGVDHPYAFSESDVVVQTDAFRRTFGLDPICTVNHFVHWTGWHEPATWFSRAGVRADNSFLHQVLDRAAHDELTLNLFYHPVYLAEWPTCRQAIDEGLRYLAERNLDAVHLGNDALWRWWDARHRSSIDAALADGQAIRFRARCAFPDGMIVKIPAEHSAIGAILVDGEAVTHAVKTRAARYWAYAIVPAGEPEVIVALAPP
ncbi:MAG TPA: hypothetical protein VIP78_01800 [Candidatus Dormibacteraeota bacterium]